MNLGATTPRSPPSDTLGPGSLALRVRWLFFGRTEHGLPHAMRVFVRCFGVHVHSRQCFLCFSVELGQGNERMSSGVCRPLSL